MVNPSYPFSTIPLNTPSFLLMALSTARATFSRWLAKLPTILAAFSTARFGERMKSFSFKTRSDKLGKH